MSVFVNQMRKFLVKSAQVLKIRLKMGVNLTTNEHELTQISFFLRLFSIFYQFLMNLRNSYLREFDYVDYSGKLYDPPSPKAMA